MEKIPGFLSIPPSESCKNRNLLTRACGVTYSFFWGGGFQVIFLEVAVSDLHLSDPKVTWQLGVAWNMGPVRMALSLGLVARGLEQTAARLLRKIT